MVESGIGKYVGGREATVFFYWNREATVFFWNREVAWVFWNKEAADFLFEEVGACFFKQGTGRRLLVMANNLLSSQPKCFLLFPIPQPRSSPKKINAQQSKHKRTKMEALAPSSPFKRKLCKNRNFTKKRCEMLPYC